MTLLGLGLCFQLLIGLSEGECKGWGEVCWVGYV